MKKWLVALFTLFFTIAAAGQMSIKGVVVNDATGLPIVGSSVFISNSSKGTVSNNSGQFELNNIPPGKYDLVISCIGYETNVMAFSVAQLPLRLKVELTLKAKELENVIVEPSIEEGWDKWGKMFMENFIGSTQNALQCNIKNTNKIRFRYYKKSNRVIAYCNEPVLIENKALGYTLKYQLENFEVNYKDRTTFYLGYPLFEDMTKDGKQIKGRWAKNRQEAFKGSVTHFMQALYSNKLAAEDFEVRRMVRGPNLEKERVKAIYKATVISNGETNGNGVSIIISGKAPDTGGDSSAYYQRIMRQPDQLDVYGSTILTADSIIVANEGRYKGLHFNDYLYITYKGEKEEEAYLRTQMEKRSATFQRSLVILINGELITLDEAGSYFNPQDFLTSGYWGWSEKMANLLPTDYVIYEK
ncbi:MAG: carboxypeptidase-like regulatory domain-containing protein [Chitinophagaceae bacterium]|nr:carboxypeptidase-like regulatory domain-containing protein [Chitinophagaceae bacterium]